MLYPDKTFLNILEFKFIMFQGFRRHELRLLEWSPVFLNQIPRTPYLYCTELQLGKFLNKPKFRHLVKLVVSYMRKPPMPQIRSFIPSRPLDICRFRRHDIMYTDCILFPSITGEPSTDTLLNTFTRVQRSRPLSVICERDNQFFVMPGTWYTHEVFSPYKILQKS